MTMILTTLGEIDDSELINKTGSEEDFDKILTWNEYWKNDELVHRSVHCHLKQGIDLGMDAASII